MSDLRLSFACGNYDRMEALRNGAVEIDGIDLDYIEIKAPREIFDRMVQNHEFDVSEMSSAEFVSMTAKGENPFVGLPVFPSKCFRHGFICINRNAGIETPKDLEGRRIGTPLYTQSAMIYIRGDLQHEYGVDLDTIHWVQGAVEKVGTHGTPHALPHAMRISCVCASTSACGAAVGAKTMTEPDRPAAALCARVALGTATAGSVPPSRGNSSALTGNATVCENLPNGCHQSTAFSHTPSIAAKKYNSRIELP